MIRRIFQAFLPMLLLMAAVVPCAAQTDDGPKHSKEYRSAVAKIEQVQSDANRGTPQQMVFTAEELSAYVNEGGVNLPLGVDNVKFTGRPGVITGVTKVDFDKITAGKMSMNPLMMLFTGIHEVTVIADAEGTAGRATLNVQSVQIDGVTVPRTALEFFVTKYIQPKYGHNIGMNDLFQMPAHIDSATVGENTLTVVQK